MDNNEIRSLEVDDWVVKLREPGKEGSDQVILLFHGWTGDENSMWVFASQLPKDALLIAPRAPYPSSPAEYGGYSWRGPKTVDWSQLDDYRPTIERLNKLIQALQATQGYDLSKFGIVGFSQGAAVAYVYAILHPERVTNLAGLAGFMPDNSEIEIENRPLEGKPIFVAHGNKDELVPIDYAKKSVKILKQAGGLVTYCEADVGHKLGANCYRELKSFFGGGK